MSLLSHSPQLSPSLLRRDQSEEAEVGCLDEGAHLIQAFRVIFLHDAPLCDDHESCEPVQMIQEQFHSDPLCT